MDHETRANRVRQWAMKASHPTELTLIIDNIPPDCRKNKVMNWLNTRGFKDTYDYFYLPKCFRTGKSKGYAIINIFVLEVVQDFVEAVGDADFGAGPGHLRVSLSSTQGLEASMAKWVRARSRRIRDAEVLPYVRSLDRSGVAHPSEAGAGAADPPGRCGGDFAPAAQHGAPGSNGTRVSRQSCGSAGGTASDVSDVAFCGEEPAWPGIGQPATADHFGYALRPTIFVGGVEVDVLYRFSV